MKISRCADPLVGSLIHHYEAGLLDEAERDQFEEHLLKCDFCAKEVESMYALSTAMVTSRETIRAGLARDGINLETLRGQLATNRSARSSRGGRRGAFNRIAAWLEMVQHPAGKWVLAVAGVCVILAVAVTHVLDVRQSAKIGRAHV
jgi:anti-sigma factor RsiW